jgi:hypothetical protein
MTSSSVTLVLLHQVFWVGWHWVVCTALAAVLFMIAWTIQKMHK